MGSIFYVFESLNKLIENEVKETDLDFYSVIIGSKPSQGARSPSLWNKVYKLEQKNIRMIPLDVKEEKLKHLFTCLKEDKRCLGGAVAVPFKEKIYSLIKDYVKEEIKVIGAINCFYRSESDLFLNEFTGTNTDGEAALEPVREYLTRHENLNIGILGFGGAGKAISAFLLKDFKEKHKIHIFNRSPVELYHFEKDVFNLYSMNDLDTYFPHIDLLINATSAGHIENIDASPVSAQILKKAKKTMLVYDIIYDPIKTELLKNSEGIGLRTINGLRMNLIQAVLAYRYTNNTSLSMEEIYQTMN